MFSSYFKLGSAIRPIARLLIALLLGLGLAHCAGINPPPPPADFSKELDEKFCIKEVLLLSDVLGNPKALTSEISESDCAGKAYEEEGYFETWHVYADETVTLTLDAESEFDSVMELALVTDYTDESITETVVAQNDDRNADDARAFISATLDAGRNYLLRMSSFGDEETGDYTIRVTEDPNPPPPPPTGSVQVQVSSTGQAPANFTARLNGAKAKPIPANGTAQYTGILTGDYAVELTELGDCSVVEGDNPEDIDVLADQTAMVAFSVECPILAGTIRVTSNTIGDSPDPSYSVSIDDRPQGTIGPTASKDYTVLAGSHNVELGDVSSSCVVISPNPTTVNVSDGGTATVTFDLDCPPPEGTIRVTTNTIGNSPDPSYSVSIDDSPQGNIGPTASKDYAVLAGSHNVELGDVASNCVVISTNPTTVSVSNGGTATVTFDLDCPPPEGTIRVTTNTIGNSPDPSYALSIDGSSQGTIGSSASKNYSVLAGSHTVLLGDIAGNCTPLSTNPQTVNVADGGTATVAFNLDCPTPQGTLRVVTNTSGSSPDPSYALSIDGNAQGTIGSSASKNYSVLAGSHTVLLGDIAGNCTPLSTNPQTVNVAAGGTTTVTFNFDCPSPQGTLRVVTNTSGSSPDPSYTLSIDGSSQGTIGSSASKDYSVLAGSHTVLLGDIAANCTPLSTNPQTVNVADGGTTTVTFNLDCPSPQGTLRVVTNTSGSSPDPSYTLSIDGSSQGTIGSSASKNYSVLVGSHTVLLSGVASNCNLLSTNPQTVNVANGGTTTVTFNLDCPLTLGSIRVTTVTTQNVCDSSYEVSIDGSSNFPIGPNNTRNFDVFPGIHVVSLSDIDNGCYLTMPPDQTVDVVGGEITPVTFTLECLQCLPSSPRLLDLAIDLMAPGQCGVPNTSWYRYTVTYEDQDGDVTWPETRVFVDLAFSNGYTDSYESASQYNSVLGDGFTGTILADNCLAFGSSSWVDVTITIVDALGFASDPITRRESDPGGIP